MKHTVPLALVAALAVGTTACKKDSEDPATPGDTHEHHHATVRLAFHFKLGENPYTLDSVLTDGAGHKVKLSQVRFFISGAHTINDESVVVGEFPDAYLLLDASQATNDFELGEMEVNHIHEVQFDLGLDSATNHSDPTLFTEPPLNDASMHWSWNPDMGYKFFVLEGQVDDDGDGVVDADDPSFIVHCAGDDLRTPDHIHVHHTLVEGETFTGQGQVEMTAILADIDVLANPSSMGVNAVTTQAMANLAAAVDEAE